MLLNMIVVMTSWMPILTLSSAGMAAQSAPPIMAAITTTGRCRYTGSFR